MAWGGDLIVFVAPGEGHLTNLDLPGEGIFEYFFAQHGTGVGMDLTADSDRRDRTYVSPLPCLTHTMYGLERSGNHGSQREQAKIKVSGFYCIDQLNLLRYCGIKVNGSKEKPSRFLQVQLISVWLTFAAITV